MHRQSSWVVQGEARVHIALEAAVEGVEVLFQLHVVEGQCPAVVVQSHTDSHRVHCNPQVRTPAVMEELVLMPGVGGGSKEPVGTRAYLNA